jgi:hypothetical protein
MSALDRHRHAEGFRIFSMGINSDRHISGDFVECDESSFNSNHLNHSSSANRTDWRLLYEPDGVQTASVSMDTNHWPIEWLLFASGVSIFKKHMNWILKPFEVSSSSRLREQEDRMASPAKEVSRETWWFS